MARTGDIAGDAGDARIGRRAAPARRAILVSVFVVAAYGQFLSGSAIVGAAGLAMQTLLAIALIVRWRLSA